MLETNVLTRSTPIFFVLGIALTLASAVACGDDDGGADTGAADTGAADGGDGSIDGSTDGSTGDGGSCVETPPAQLCVRGPGGATGYELTADAPVQIRLLPLGCHSSACTIPEVATCTATVTEAGLDVAGQFCLATEGECSLPDCSGGGSAACDADMVLPAGDYVATLGELSVPFTIPSVIPFGEGCDGDPLR